MIMTTRQIWSVLLSCVVFGHNLPGVAVGACGVVFSVLLIRSYRSAQAQEPGAKADAAKIPAEAAPSEASTDNQSQVAAAFGLARGMAGKFSSKAAALTGKLRG